MSTKKWLFKNMNKLEFLKNTEEFVKERMGNKDIDIHGYRHVERVRKWAQIVGEKEGVDNLFLLDVAALLHDIGRSIEKELDENGSEIGHYKAGEKIAREYLSRNKELFSEKEIKKILFIIRNHGEGEGDILLKVVQDADRLDLLGAVGLARSFAFLFDKPFYIDDNSFVYKNWAEKAGKINWHVKTRLWHLSAVDNTIFNLNASKKLNTKTAKILAQEKIKFTKEFLKQLRKETVLL